MKLENSYNIDGFLFKKSEDLSYQIRITDNSKINKALEAAKKLELKFKQLGFKKVFHCEQEKGWIDVQIHDNINESLENLINYKESKIYKQLIKDGFNDISGSIQQKRGVIQLELPEKYKRDIQNAYIIYPETGTIRHLGNVSMPPKSMGYIAKSESRNISKLKEFGKLETLEDYDKCFEYIQQLLEKRKKKSKIEESTIKTFTQFVNESKWILTIDCSSKWSMLDDMEENDEFDKEGDLDKAVVKFCDFIIGQFEKSKKSIEKLLGKDELYSLESKLDDLEAIKTNSYELLEEFQEEFNWTWDDIYDWCNSNKIWIKTKF